ncbi:MAG TPA: TolC family protein [Candidatus Acidoferrales bacterium]|nr:TolC family protein [Candidatus Acidoferrales bacterium]
MNRMAFAAMALLASCAIVPPSSAQDAPPSAALSVQKLTLAQALDMAERQNLDLIAARAQRTVSAAGVRIAQERPNPTGNFNALRDDPHEGWWFDMPIELNSKRQKRIDLAHAEEGLTDDDISALEKQLRQNVRDAFFALALARGVTEEKNDTLKLAQRLHDIAQQRYETGDVPQLEVFQAELEVSQAQADYEVAQKEARVALNELNALLSEPPSTDWDLVNLLSDLPAKPALDTLFTRARAANAELQRITQEEKVEQSQLALYKADRVPNLTLSLGVDYNAPHNFRYGPRSQASMEIPIFSRNQGEIAESSASLIALQDQSLATRRAVEGRVESAYLELDSRETQAQLYNASLLPASERLESMAEESYRAGKANILSVLEAQKNVQQVREEYLQSLFAVQQAFAQLEETVGAPLD